MAKALAVVLVAGLGVGIVGGLLSSAAWLAAGGLIAVLGVVALYLAGVLKNPIAVAKAEAVTESARYDVQVSMKNGLSGSGSVGKKEVDAVAR